MACIQFVYRGVLVAAVLIAMCGAAFSANLLTNPGFESDSGPDSIPGWTNWKSDWAANTNRQCVTSYKVSGSKSLQLSTTNASFGVYQSVNVTIGRAYQMNGWWKGSFGPSGTYWFDCELLDGPYNLTVADSRPQDLPYKVATYDPPVESWAWQKLSDAYYTTKELLPTEILPQKICRNGIRIATANTMLVLLKVGTNNNYFTSVGYYDDMSLEEVPTMTVAEAKKQADTKAVMLEGVTVSCVKKTTTSGYIYVQPTDRSAGIKVQVDYPFSAAVGQVAKIAGVVMTDSTTGERYIEASYIYCSGSGSAKPLAMPIKSLGLTSDSAGSSPLGLLVRISGKVTSVPDSHTFYLDDGSGPIVKCVTPNSVYSDASWKFACVTGVGSYYMDGAEKKLTVMVRQTSDMQPITLP